MLQLQTLSLKNVIVFKEENLKLTDNSGLVVISGHNKDAHIADDSTNAVGKSLLLSSIPNVRYQSTPVSIRKKSKKDLLDDKKSCISLGFVANDGKYIEVDQTASKYTIKENGEDIQIRTAPLAEKYLEKAWPITQEEFYSYCYIQSQRHLQFQVGSPTDRLAFITNVFRLNIFDDLKKHFKNKLDKIHDEEIKFKTLETKLNSIVDKLKDIQWSKDKNDKLKILKKKQEKLKSKLDRAYDEQNALVSLLKALDQLVKVDKELEELRSKYPFKENPETMRKKLREMKKLARNWADYKTALKQYESTVGRIKDKLKTLEETNDFSKIPSEEECKEQYKELENKKKRIGQSLDQQREFENEYCRAKSAVDTYRSKLSELSISKEELANSESVLAELSSARHMLKAKDLLSEHDGHSEFSCPTCAQTVDFNRLRKLVKKAEKTVEKVESIKEALEINTHLEASIKRLKKAKIDYDSKLKKELSDKYDKIASSIKKLEKKFSLRRDHNILLSTLQNASVPQKPKDKPAYSMDQIEEYLDICDEVLKHLEAKKNLIAMNVRLEELANPKCIGKNHKKLEKEAQAKKKEVEDLVSSYDSCSKLVNKYELKQAEYRTLEEQRLEIEKSLEDIRPLLKKRKLFQCLVMAYSSKGLKIQAANTVLKMLESNMNRFSGLIFAEPFRFEIVTDKSGIHVLVHRPNKKVSDVRMLSGAETNCFRLLFAISILPLIPEHRRLNILVLDEPDCHMDAPVRHRLINDFIPKLRTVVPHIFFITPKSVDEFPDAELWTVVKTKGISRIVTNGRK